MSGKKIAKWAIALGLLVQLGACAWPGFLTFKGTKLDWKEVTLSAAPGANDNSPVAVDVVLVFDEEMLTKLAELPARQWFGVRSDLRKTYPQSFSYRTWELVPGQSLQIPGEKFGSPRVVGVFMYADYVSAGAHRLRVEPLQGSLLARFEKQQFVVSSAP